MDWVWADRWEGVSRSTRTTCWCSATMRDFCVVTRVGSMTTPETSMPRRPRSSRSWRPGASSPTTLNKETEAPRAQRLLQTLPAPPGMWVSSHTLTTGTGASGEMRRTLPRMKWSSIRSPRTRTRLRGNFSSSEVSLRVGIIVVFMGKVLQKCIKIQFGFRSRTAVMFPKMISTFIITG